jgi:VCBS repeat-containing protein
MTNGIFTGDTSATTDEDTATSGTLTFTDAADGATAPNFRIEVNDEPTNGTASINATSGAWTYTPNFNFNGTDSFIVSVTDDAGNVETQLVTITVTQINDPGIFTGDTSAATYENTVIGGTLRFTDVADGFITSNYTIFVAAANGTAYLGFELGSWVYAPNFNFIGSDSFTVSVTDDDGNVETQVISITVNTVTNMTNGTVTYSGLSIAKGAVYAQKCGMTPDRIQVRLIPQSSAIASIGDLVLDFNASNEITIKDALADKSHIWMTNEGFTGTLIFEDRRWRWSRYPRFSAHFNARDANGDIIADTQTSLSDILLDAFTHIGESNVILNSVPTDFYPEINVQCVEADKLIEQLTDNLGYNVCLGFGSDAVNVYPQGTGAALPTGSALMAFSKEVDPPTAPQYFNICFGPSVAQARFKLGAIGLDTDGNYKPLNSLSYVPSGGWEDEPFDMPNVRDQHGDEAWDLALKTVYKTYAIKTFADGTLNYPDGSGTLTSITQVLPFFDKLLEIQTLDGVKKHPPVRVYGSYITYSFPAMMTRVIGQEVKYPWEFNRYHGVVTFEEQVHLVNNVGPNQTTVEADLYLEAMFRITDTDTHQFVAYVWETVIDASGEGYATHHDPSLNARTIVLYDDNHGVIGTLTNRTTLDEFAQSVADSTVGKYTTKARYMNWYNKPMASIRTDGLTSQIRHVISDGEDGEPGHYTIATQNSEFDIFSRSSREVKTDSFVQGTIRDNLSKESTNLRTLKAND